ncbi:MAG: hypothetical protein HY897_06415 [Deltaproteobacteria bacterium]|nr:hypothetical protein [Deltaproteobacteria bacterium]
MRFCFVVLIVGAGGLLPRCDEEPRDDCTEMCRRMSVSECVPISASCLDTCEFARKALPGVCEIDVDRTLACGAASDFICDERGLPYPVDCFVEWRTFWDCIDKLLSGDAGTPDADAGSRDTGPGAKGSCKDKPRFASCIAADGRLGVCYEAVDLIECTIECDEIGTACDAGFCHFLGTFEEAPKPLCLPEGAVATGDYCEKPNDCAAGGQCYKSGDYGPYCYQPCRAGRLPVARPEPRAGLDLGEKLNRFGGRCGRRWRREAGYEYQVAGQEALGRRARGQGFCRRHPL